MSILSKICLFKYFGSCGVDVACVSKPKIILLEMCVSCCVVAAEIFTDVGVNLALV